MTIITTKDRFYGIIIIILILIILFFKMCSGKKCADEVVSIKSDTTYVTIKDTIKEYTPHVTKYIPVNTQKIIYKTDSIIEYELLHVDTAAILKDYYATRFYSDSIRVMQYGTITVNDSVSKNRITSREVIPSLNIPVVTNTVTIKEKPRNQVYFGLNGMANQNVTYAGASLLLKTRKDFIIEGGAALGTDGQLLYGFGMKFKIKLKR